MLPTLNSEKAITLALSLAKAENAINGFTSGQVDAILDSEGNTYLLRPAQERLRRKEKQMEAVLDAVEDVITIVDRGGEILYQNHATNRQFGYEPDELVGNLFFECVHEDDLPEAFSAFVDVIEGFHDSAHAEFRYLASDGEWHHVDSTVSIMKDDSSPKVLICMRNHASSANLMLRGIPRWLGATPPKFLKKMTAF